MLDLSGKKVSHFKANRPGKAWWLGFLSRHPDLSLKNAEALDVARAADCSQANILSWHKKYEDVLKQFEITNPEYICNCDETGFALQSKSGKILTDKGHKNPYSISSSNKSQMTVLMCGTASGKVLPPFILFPGKTINPSYAVDLTAEATCFPTEKGWMNKEAFLRWIKEVFIPYWPKASDRGYILLLLDGHTLHINYETSKLCLENKIHLFRLPPNCTHLLQPLDRGFFGPLKANWKRRSNEFFRQSKSTLDKFTFGRVFAKAYVDSTRSEIMENSFRACGMWPVDAAAIDMTKAIPAQAFESNIQEAHTSRQEVASPQESNQPRLIPSPMNNNENYMQFIENPTNTFSYTSILNEPTDSYFFEAEPNLSPSNVQMSTSLQCPNVNVTPSAAAYLTSNQELPNLSAASAPDVSPTTRIFNSLTPLNSRSSHSLKEIEDKLTTSERVLFNKRYEENCDIGSEMYLAWYHLKKEEEKQKKVRKEAIKKHCIESNNSALARRELFRVPNLTRKRKLTKAKKVPLLLTSSKALETLEEQVIKKSQTSIFSTSKT